MGATVACVVALASAAPGSARSTIRWYGCGRELPPSLQCGQLAVPLDYRHPRGPKIRLGFDRLRADRRHRVGSLIVNPGGPGGAGSVVVALEQPVGTSGIRRCTAAST